MKINLKTGALLCAALFLLLFLSMLFFNVCTPLMADDYCYSLLHYDGSHKSFGFMDVMSMQYHDMNGRLLLHALLTGALLLPRFCFVILNAAVYCLLMYLIYKIAGFKHNPIFLLFCMILCWFFLPAFGETVLWTTGSSNYLWGAIFILIFVRPYAKSLSEQITYGKAAAIRLAVLGLLAGATNENTAGAAILFCGLTLLVTFIRERKRVPVWMLAGLAGAVIGFLFMIFAPSNFVRLDNVGSAPLYERLITILSASKRLYLPLAVIYVCLLSASFFVYKRSAVQKSLPSMLLALCGYAAVAVMFMLPVAPDRSFFGGVVFMIIAVLFQAKVLFEEFESKNLLLLPSLCLASAIFAFSLTQTAFELRAIKNHSDSRDTYIREQIAQGERDVTVPELRPQTFRSALSTLGDISEDTYGWKNGLVANYYLLDSIAVDKVIDLPYGGILKKSP